MMDERERRDIMLRAIHRYGETAQIDMAVDQQYKPGIWSRTVDDGAQPCEGGAPDE